MAASIKCYGGYAQDNYGSNCMAVDLGFIKIWFSYRTPIAFRKDGERTQYIRHNDWGPTTGRHMRHAHQAENVRFVKGEEFEERLNAVLDGRAIRFTKIRGRKKKLKPDPRPAKKGSEFRRFKRLII